MIKKNQKPRTYKQMHEGTLTTEKNNMLKSKDLLPQQIKTINKYIEYNESLGNKLSTIRNYARDLGWLGKAIKKPYESMNKDDLVKYFASIKDKKGKSRACKISLKTFFKWLGKPELIEWIKVKNALYDTTEIDPKEILTPADVKKLADHTLCFRDKVLILVMYDSACRISEILSTRVQDFTINEHGVNMFLPASKTRKRNIQLIESAPEVIQYLNQHPYKDDSNAPFFYKDRPRGEALGEKGARAILTKIKAKICFKKKVNPHWFRHSKLTLEAQDLTDAQLKIYAGWSNASNMTARYIHLKDSDVTKIRLIKKGLIAPDSKDAKDDSLTPKICPRCKEHNSFSDEYCRRCWIPLNQKAYQDVVNAQGLINKELMDQQLPPSEAVILSIVKKLMKQGKISKT